ncbi:uncharacterized protein LOC120009637 [Tripterygium wilfordii]|uniref:uncharacterized protein LOC120009637 n=1 Tax=Tripterygium wilfordii TaxID=458696 RepID=UPI0018F7F0B0|nr:uncharacterized protein LOC120009637 [Tripterygium wilfordii]
MEYGESSRDNRKRRKCLLDEQKRDRGLILSPTLATNQHHSATNTLVHQLLSFSSLPTTELNSVPLNFGHPSCTCEYCGAIFWFAERLKSAPARAPVYSLCCRQGRIKLAQLREPPTLLRQLMDYLGGRCLRLFRKNLQTYNSMFALTSIGGKIDNDINKGQGPYIFKLNGQNHHLIGSLLPVNGVEKEIVSQLIHIFDDFNHLVKAFRMARDKFKAGDERHISLLLSARRQIDSSQYDAPAYPEMASLVVGDIGYTDEGRDIIVEYQGQQLKRISDLHPSFMAMQYPILFPYGEDCYRLNIPYEDKSQVPKLKRGNITRREYYAYMI